MILEKEGVWASFEAIRMTANLQIGGEGGGGRENKGKR